MKTPAYLKKGDTIGIVACARKISEEELEAAVHIMRAWGLNVVNSNNLFQEDHQFSGTDEQRAEDMQAMLDNKEVKAIISARGGYGTMRIIDKLDFGNFVRQPKWIIGYSDITVLHSHIHNLGVETLHATMPINFSKNEEATESLRKALFGEPLKYAADHHLLNRSGNAEGEITGGNLSLLYALIGSGSDTDTKGKILFIEDLDEYLYHIDRMMLSLKRAGKLDKLAGLVVGGMSDMKDNLVPFGKTAEEIIYDAVKEFDYPVAFNFPSGHIERNLGVVLGRKMKLFVEQGSRLEIYNFTSL